MDTTQLKDAFLRLPSIAGKNDPEHRSWPFNQIAFRDHVRNDDPRELLCWSTTRATMYVDNAKYIRQEWEELQKAPDPARFRKACQRSSYFEYPTPPMIEMLDNNLIHQCYHLWQLEKASMRRINTYKTIAEFGGGYGSMAHACRSLGFKGLYVIFDLPEMSLLQQYYLSNVDIAYPVQTMVYSPQVTLCLHVDLMIACWSLSEADLPTRNKFMHQVKANNYLIAYGAEWFNIDNERYFRGLPTRAAKTIEWTKQPAAMGGTYLLGVWHV